MLRLAEIIGSSLEPSEHGVLTEFAAHKTNIPAEKSEILRKLRLLETSGNSDKLTELGCEVVRFLHKSR